jgi:hypothetical protein
MAAPASSPRIPIKTSAFWPAYPPSVVQAAFLALPHMEAFYGGAAGGGKSDALLRAALQYVDVPGYKALLFRRTFPELAQPSGLIDRAHEWLSGKAHWNETKHRWTFPSGAILEFGYLHRSTDKYRYQGAELDFIGFDELTHFEEADYRYLFSRLRRKQGSSVPPRMRAASNPGGTGHRWVKRRFIDKKPAEDDPNDTPERCAARIFIPAKLPDNPGVDQGAYREALEQLDPQELAQLLDGDWDARPPGPWIFDSKAIDAAVELGTEYDRLRSIGQMMAPVDHAMQSGIDFGDFATAFEPMWPMERGGLYVPPGEIATSRVDVEDIALQALKAMAVYPFWWSESRYDSSFAQSNRTFVRVAQQALGMHNMVARTGRPNSYPAHFNKYKLLAVRYIRLLLRRTLEAKEAGWPPGEKLTRLLAISPEAVRLIEQMRDYRYKEEDGQDRPAKGNDDHVDALIAGVTPVARKHRAVVEKDIAEAKRKAALAQPQKPVSTPPGAIERLQIRGG